MSKYTICLLTVLLSTSLALANTDIASKIIDKTANAMPTNAKVGECYAKVSQPAEYKTEFSNVEVRPEITNFKKLPAQYKKVQTKVLVKEESEKLIVVPATYKTVVEDVVVKEEVRTLKRIKPTFKTVKEKVLISEETSEWKRDTTSGNASSPLCLVKKPAVYKTITKVLLDQAERFEETVIPAVSKKFNRIVVDQPATTKVVKIPAEYKTISKTVTVEQERTTQSTTPAQFKKVARQVKVADKKSVWKRVLCKMNSNSTSIKKVQNALKAVGINPGNIDGVLGSDTLRAINTFQKKNNLSTGALTYDTLRTLGVSL